MALKILAYLTVFLGMAVCAEALGLCLAGERLTCVSDPPDCNITDTGPLWIQSCAEYDNSCFNSTHTFMATGSDYMYSSFGCINIPDNEDNCETVSSTSEVKHPTLALGIQLFREELNATTGVTFEIEMKEFETCICKNDNCNGVLMPRDRADNNIRANSIVWPIIIGSMFATVALIAIGAAVSLFA